jgi:hypothetical protein
MSLRANSSLAVAVNLEKPDRSDLVAFLSASERQGTEERTHLEDRPQSCGRFPASLHIRTPQLNQEQLGKHHCPGQVVDDSRTALRTTMSAHMSWCPYGTPCGECPLIRLPHHIPVDDALAQTRGRQTCVLQRGLVSLNGDGLWSLTLDPKRKLPTLRSETQSECFELLALAERRSSRNERNWLALPPILLNCLLLVLPLVIRAELFPSVRRSIVWDDTSVRHGFKV